MRIHDQSILLPGGVAATRAEAAGTPCQDRVLAFRAHCGIAVAVVDGAGGVGDGAAAADFTLHAMLEGLSGRCDDGSLCALLHDVDVRLCEAGVGECDAVVALANGEWVVGAGVGGARAWLVGDQSVVDLTRAQHRTPRLGTSAALPVPFRARHNGGRLLAATDGLWHYAQPTEAAAAARTPNLQAAARALIDLCRLRSGTLPDDIALALIDLSHTGKWTWPTGNAN